MALVSFGNFSITAAAIIYIWCFLGEREEKDMAFGMKDTGSKPKSGGSIPQGGLNNYSEVPVEQLQQEYGMYLMDGETIQVGFKLIRDSMLFTDKRIIFTDKQGATGKKMRIESINLFSVVDVTMETAGFGFDDSELTFTYIKTANLTAHDVQYISHKLEFPKKFNVQPLYKMLQELAYTNCLRIKTRTPSDSEVTYYSIIVYIRRCTTDCKNIVSSSGQPCKRNKSSRWLLFLYSFLRKEDDHVGRRN